MGLSTITLSKQTNTLSLNFVIGTKGRIAVVAYNGESKLESKTIDTDSSSEASFLFETSGINTLKVITTSPEVHLINICLPGALKEKVLYIIDSLEIGDTDIPDNTNRDTINDLLFNFKLQMSSMIEDQHGNENDYYEFAGHKIQKKQSDLFFANLQTILSVILVSVLIGSFRNVLEGTVQASSATFGWGIFSSLFPSQAAFLKDLWTVMLEWLTGTPLGWITATAVILLVTIWATENEINLAEALGVKESLS